jgi:hypothetical protein
VGGRKPISWEFLNGFGFSILADYGASFDAGRTFYDHYDEILLYLYQQIEMIYAISLNIHEHYKAVL